MKKKVLSILIALCSAFATIGFASCDILSKLPDPDDYQNVGHYTVKLDTKDFNPVQVYDSDFDYTGLTLLYSQALNGEVFYETTIDVRPDMIIDGGKTDSVGDKTVTISYHEETWTIDYTVKYQVDFLAYGKAFDTQYVMEASEIVVPDPTAQAKAGYVFAFWEAEVPETLSDNLSIEAHYYDTTLEVPSLSAIDRVYNPNATLKDIELPSRKNVGKWEFVDALTTPIGGAGAHEFDVRFVPATDELAPVANSKVIINVAKQLVDKPTISENVFTYDGTAKTVLKEAFELFTVSNNVQTNAGTYTVGLTLKDPANYAWSTKNPDSTFTIKPKQVTFEILDNSFDYDGEEHRPEYKPSEENVQINENIRPRVEVGVSNFTLSVNDPNYTGSYRGSFEVKKPDVTIVVDNKEITYGENIPEITYTVKGFTGDLALLNIKTVKPSNNGAGVHTITVAVNNDNVNVVEIVSGTLTIHKANLTTVPNPVLSTDKKNATYGDLLSSVTFENAALGIWVWKEPNTVIDKMNGIEAVAVFTHMNPNYNSYEIPLTINNIAKRELVIEVTKDTYTYTGDEFKLEYVIKDKTIEGLTYEGLVIDGDEGAVNAGTYPIELKIVSDCYKGTFNTKLKITQATPKAELSEKAATVTWQRYMNLKRSGITLAGSGEGTYAWADPDTELDRDELIDTPTNFKVVFTPTDTQNYTTKEFDFTITVEKAGTEITNVQDKIEKFYDGVAYTLSAGVNRNSENSGIITYEYRNAAGEKVDAIVNVGTYKVIITAAETAHYVSATKEISVEIKKATITFDEAWQNVNGWTYGEDVNLPTIGVVRSNGGKYEVAIVYEYTDKDGKPVTEFTSKTTAGTYKVTAIVKDTQNYDGTSTKPQAFTIEKATVTAPSLVQNSFVYTGNAPTLSIAESENSKDKYTFAQPTEADAGSYSVMLTLKDGNNYEWDNESNETTLAFEITKAANVVTELTVEGWTYNETAKTPTVEASNEENVTYYYRTKGAVNWTEWTDTNAPKNAGTYELAVDIAVSTNYNKVEKYTVADFTFVIAKATVELPTLPTGKLIYNENYQLIVTDGDKGLYTVAITAENNTEDGNAIGINAGDYTVTLTIDDFVNYKWANSDVQELTYNYTINQAHLGYVHFATPNAVTWYDGLTLADIEIPNNYAWAIDKNTALEPGTRSYGMVYTHPSGNYVPVNGSVQVTVNKIKEEITGVEATYSGTYSEEFEGITLNPIVKNTEATIVYTYTQMTFDGSLPGKITPVGNTFTMKNAGTYFVTISVAETEHYTAAEFRVQVIISQAKVEFVQAEWEVEAGWDPEPRETLSTLTLPTSPYGVWSWAEGGNTVIDEVDAEKKPTNHTLIFTSSNPNYRNSSATAELTVDKALVVLKGIALTDPDTKEAVEATYSGKDITATITVQTNKRGLPLAYGTDYIYTVDEEDSIHAWFTVKYAKTYTVVIELIGEAAESYHFNQQSTFTYNLIIEEAEVAAPELTAYIDNKTTFTTGEQIPVTLGTFDAVDTNYTVSLEAIEGSLTDGKAINVGKYKLTVKFAEGAIITNYVWTNVTEQGWILDEGTDTLTYIYDIEKATVRKPELLTETLTYTGSEQTATIQHYYEEAVYSTLYKISGEKGKTVDDYTVKATLLVDTKNYKWADGDENAEFTLGTFEIKKAKVAVTFNAPANYIFNNSAPEITLEVSVVNCKQPTYSVAVNGVVGAAYAKTAGTHTVTITLGDYGNYEWETDTKVVNGNKEFKYVILQKAATAPSFTNKVEEKTFDETIEVTVGGQTISLNQGPQKEYNGENDIPVSIPKSAEGVDITEKDVTVTVQNLDASMPALLADDAWNLTITEAGTYLITLKLENSNYSWPSDLGDSWFKDKNDVDVIYFIYVINEAEVEAPTLNAYTNNKTTFTTAAQIPVTLGRDYEAVDTTYSVTIEATSGSLTNGEAVNVGTYKITVKFAEDANVNNYVWANLGDWALDEETNTLSYTYTITPKSVGGDDIAKLEEALKPYTYNGNYLLPLDESDLTRNDGVATISRNGYTITITMTDYEAKSVDGSVDFGADAGSYTIKLTLDNGNYKWSDETTAVKEFTYTINKATVTLGEWGEGGWTYGDAEKPLPTIAINERSGDGDYDVDIEYHYSTDPNSGYSKIGQNTFTSTTPAGDYYIKAKVVGTDNYEGTEDLSVEKKFIIKKVQVMITAPTYTGLYQNQLDIESKYNDTLLEVKDKNGRDLKSIVRFSRGVLEFNDGNEEDQRLEAFDGVTNNENAYFKLSFDIDGNYEVVADFETGKVVKDYVTVYLNLKEVAYIEANSTKTYYGTIENALYAATQVNEEVAVWVVPDPSGDVVITGGESKQVEIPSKVTLILPYGTVENPVTNSSRTDRKAIYEATLYNSSTVTADGKGSPEYAGLNALKCITSVTMASGVTLTVNGTLEIGGELSGSSGGGTLTGHTAGDYAEIVLGAGSKIEVNGTMRCFGFIRESSLNENYSDTVTQVKVNDGGTVAMPFVLRDFRGGDYTVALYGIAASDIGSLIGAIGKLESDNGIPFFNQFEFRNISSWLYIEKGGILNAYANLYAGGQQNATSIKFVGDDDKSFIQLTTEYSYMTAKYNVDIEDYTVKTDGAYCKLNLYGGATIREMSLTISVSVLSKDVSTADVYFPLSWRYDVTLDNNEAKGQNAAMFTMEQLCKMLPGAKLTIEQGATLKIDELNVYDGTFTDTNTKAPNVNYPSGKGDAVLTVRGTLIANKLAGKVVSDVNGAKVEVKNSGALTTYEAKSEVIDDKQPVANTLQLPKYDGNVVYSSAGIYKSIGNGWKLVSVEILADTDGDSTDNYSFYTNGEIGETCTLTAPTKEGYTFTGWTLVSPTDGSVTLNGDMLDLSSLEDASIKIYLKATFTINSYYVKRDSSVNSDVTLYITVNGKEVTVTTSGVKLEYGTQFTFKAKAKNGDDYTSEYTLNGTKQGNQTGNTDYIYTVGASDITIKETGDVPCIAEGTLITLADGTQKKVEDLTADDEILVFNHITGKYEAGKIWFNVHEGEGTAIREIINLKFSDGTATRIVGEHGFFNLTLNKYVYINEDTLNDYIGHKFYTSEYVNGEFIGGEVVLENVYIAEENVRVFSPVSEMHLNCVTDKLLSVSTLIYDLNEVMNIFELDENLKVDEEKMQADIEKYGLFTYEDFAAYVSEEAFNASPAKYWKVAIGKGLIKYEEIEKLIAYLLQNGLIQ